jgi:septation ring formation regulator EzrA
MVPEGRLTQLLHQRDDLKKQMDAASGQQEHWRARQQQLINETYFVEAILQSALGRGDLDGVRNAKARLTEIRQQRDDCADMLAAAGNRHGVLQSQYGEAFTQWQHAEGEAEYLTRRIASLRRGLATAQHRASAYSFYNDNTSPESLNAELRACASKYFALVGTPLPAEAA